MKKSLIITFLLVPIFLLLFVSFSSSIDLPGNITTNNQINITNPLTAQVTLPGILVTPLRILFGLKDNMTIQQIIILLAIWAILFIIILDATSLLPFESNGIWRFIMAIVVTSLMSLTGSFDYVARFFLGVGGSFSFTKAWQPFKIIIAAILAIILFTLLKVLMKTIRDKSQLEDAERAGQEANAAISIQRQRLRDTLD